MYISFTSARILQPVFHTVPCSKPQLQSNTASVHGHVTFASGPDVLTRLTTGYTLSYKSTLITPSASSTGGRGGNQTSSRLFISYRAEFSLSRCTPNFFLYARAGRPFLKQHISLLRPAFSNSRLVAKACFDISAELSLPACLHAALLGRLSPWLEHRTCICTIACLLATTRQMNGIIKLNANSYMLVSKQIAACEPAGKLLEVCNPCPYLPGCFTKLPIVQSPSQFHDEGSAPEV